MKHLSKIILFFSFLYVLLTVPIQAVETKITGALPEITYEPLDVNVIILGAKPATNYLKAEFFKADTIEYFGETFNGQNYYEGNEFQNYLPVDIGSEEWIGTVKIRLPQNTVLDREGEYYIRIRRYTESGNYNSDEAKTSATKIIFSQNTFSQNITPPIVENTIIPTNTAPVSYSFLTINEVYPNPKDGENEWVEIYNFNDFSVAMDNWHIDDIESGSSPRMFSIFIPAKSLGVVEFTSSIFNNDGDMVRLLDTQNNLKDTITFRTSELGKSFGRKLIGDTAICLQLPSKGEVNNPCILPTTKPEAITTSIVPSPTTFILNNFEVLESDEGKRIPSSPFPLYIKSAKNYTPPVSQLKKSPSEVLGISTLYKISPSVTGFMKGSLIGTIEILLLNCGYIIYRILFVSGKKFNIA